MAAPLNYLNDGIRVDMMSAGMTFTVVMVVMVTVSFSAGIKGAG